MLGAIGPGFAVDILGLTPENFFFIMGPAGLGAVLGILFLNSYGKASRSDWSSTSASSRWESR